MIDFTVDNAMARLKLIAQFPVNNMKISDDRLLQIMDEDIQYRLWPNLMRVREDFSITSLQITIPTGENTARLPTQTSGSTLVEVRIVNNQNQHEHILPRIELPDVRISPQNQPSSNHPYAYALMGDNILISPTPQQPTILRIVYERRPSRLTRVASCNKVVNSGRYLTLPVGENPVFSIGDHVDLVPSLPPLGIISSDVTITDVLLPPTTYSYAYTTSDGTPGTSYFTPQSPGYICPIAETCVFPLPDTWFSAWCMSSAASAAQQYGNASQAAGLRNEADQAIGVILQFEQNRVRKQPHRIFNRTSIMRTNTYGRGWGGFGGYG